MNIEEIPPQAPAITPAAYVAANVTAARQLLAQATRLIGGQPHVTEPGKGIVAPQHDLEQAIAIARNAAEHLLDAGQVDEPAEAVREALIAADAIMAAVHHLEEKPAPGLVNPGYVAAQHLRDADGKLAWIEHCLNTTNH